MTIESSKYADVIYDVLAGVIIGAHGVQGSVKIKTATDTAFSLITPPKLSRNEFADVWLAHHPRENLQLTESDNLTQGSIQLIKQVKDTLPGSSVHVVRFVDINDRNQAEALIGLNVYAPKERRAQLADDEYFTEDLIGLEVITESGRNFGKVTAVLQQPANDVYETDKSALIPAVKSVVRSIDLKSKTILVQDLLGLFQTEADELLGDSSNHLPVSDQE
jgi:16S rRNA processing protein RimM